MAVTPEKTAEDNKRAYEEMLEKKKAKQAEEEWAEGAETYEEDGASDGGSGNNPGEFSKEMLAKLHDKIDADKDGKVSMQEVVDFNKYIDHQAADNDIDDMFPNFDKNGDGKITIDEVIMDDTEGVDELDEEGETTESEDGQMKPSSMDMAAQVQVQKAMFAAADEDNDGILNKKEFKGVIHPETNHKVMLETVKMLVADKDENKDGHLNLKEFFSARRSSSRGKGELRVVG